MEQERQERVILAGVDTGEDKDFDRSMKELEDLAEACNMEVVEIVVQHLPHINKATFIGPGKVDEIKADVEMHEIDVVIFDNSLSPSQLRNLQEELGCAVMDRSALILEIFSRRAKTREARLQVEVASLQYMLPRLVGLHKALSRQGGGSGALSNKGSGEKQLELDRRYLEQRLNHLRAELETVEKTRRVQRKKRADSGIIRVALVGYTNAGKSTILNSLITTYDRDYQSISTNADDERATADARSWAVDGTIDEAAESNKLVFEQDMLFATLDTTVRRIEAKGHSPMLFSDTVGFVDKLPHHLVKAFGSTLEEAAEADVILHVIDDNDEYRDEHIDVTKKTLEELGAGDIPVIYVHNKADLSGRLLTAEDGSHMPVTRIEREDTHIFISARERIGLEEIISLVESKVDIVEAVLLVPYSRGDIVNYLMTTGGVLTTSYEADGTVVTAKLSRADYNKYSQYLF